jgi:hypothetical protein
VPFGESIQLHYGGADLTTARTTPPVAAAENLAAIPSGGRGPGKVSHTKFGRLRPGAKSGLSAELLARYRRVLSVGDILDESIQLFRRRWIGFAIVSAVALLPPGLVSVWLSASGALTRSFSLADLESGPRALQGSLADEGPAAFVGGIISMLAFLLWSAAVVVATDIYQRGGEPRLRLVYATALRRYWAVLLASLVLVIALLVLTAVGVGLFFITGLGTVGTVIAGVAALSWWLKPGARKTWLKWLIVLAAPFGLPAYFIGRWSLYIPAAVLERRGPIGALRRSGQLVDRHWFRVVAILSVASLIVGVLQWAPSTLIEVPLTISSATRGQIGYPPAQAALVNAVSVVLEILFASIGSIAYTLAFVDLRNRREGADITERLILLEAQPAQANG